MLQSKACDDLCVALYAFEKIHCFLGFVIIDDYETANAFLNCSSFTVQTERKIIASQMIAEFKRVSFELYNAGMKTFLSNRVVGDHETFYSHALVPYFVPILKRTYAKYQLGLGVFSMEGFEAINFVTKKMLRNHSNHRGNVCEQKMVKVVHRYMNHSHNVADELTKRNKKRKN